MVYTALTGPFVGLLLLGLLFPCVNSKVSKYTPTSGNALHALQGIKLASLQ